MDEVREADEVGSVGDAFGELEAAVAGVSRTAVGAGERLEALTRVLAASDRLHAAAVGLVGQVQGDPATAAADGLGVAGFLRLFARRTGGDAGMLCATADRLCICPRSPGCSRAGSWDGRRCAGSSRRPGI